MIGRVGRVDLRVVDRLVAVLLTVGALADASSQLHHGPGAPAIVFCSLLTGSVAFRRWNPVLSTVAAITGFAAFVWASGYRGDGAFEVAAIALNFYLLGRRTRARRGMFVTVWVFGYWLAGTAVIAYSVSGGSVAKVLGPWLVVGGLPFALGRTLETRRKLLGELAAKRARLEGEHEVRARCAAGEERTRMARELHDVIAHCLTVMVVQTGGARRVARDDLAAASTALALVGRSGREALVELRRLVGVVRRSGDDLAPVAAPRVSQLDALLESARAGGLQVELRIEGQPNALPAGVDLVAYRIVQEALTNVLKHAGPVRTRADVCFGARELELRVRDFGEEREPKPGERTGHGLVGMRERVALYGGSLDAGRRPDGDGFEVRARIPLDGPMSPTPTMISAADPETDIAADADGDGLRWPWLDPSVAVVSLVALEVAVLTNAHRRGPLALNMIEVALLALAAVWRRRLPLLFLIVAGTVTLASSWRLTSLSNSPLIGAFLLVVPIYAVAAWEARPKATLGLAFVLAGALLGNLGSLGNLAGALFAVLAVWGAGRAIRARRLLTRELVHTSARLLAEQEDRARLAVAGERNRVARELHAAIAGRVEAMVVQATAARKLLADQPVAADLAMGAIEGRGRETLSEMRRVLGVLRHPQDIPERAPRPGVDQLYTLIQSARERGQQVELNVEGEPGPLPAGVDLGIYRILEEALSSAREQPASTVAVLLRFGHEDLELELRSPSRAPSRWPTEAMRDRISLCGGQLDDRTADADTGWAFSVRMPCGPQPTLAAG